MLQKGSEGIWELPKLDTSVELGVASGWDWSGVIQLRLRNKGPGGAESGVLGSGPPRHLWITNFSHFDQVYSFRAKVPQMGNRFLEAEESNLDASMIYKHYNILRLKIKERPRIRLGPRILEIRKRVGRKRMTCSESFM